MMTNAYQTLISAAQLQALPADSVVLLDCSFDLADASAGPRAYAQGHLPGAHYLHLEDDLSGTKTGPDGMFRGRHPLPERAALAERLAGLGLRSDRQVVCYDAQGGMYAARAWWLLRWLGHAAVAVLDGGLQAWTAAGGQLSSTTPMVQAPGDFRAGAGLMHTIEASDLQRRLGRLRLLDARAAERFRGEVEPLDQQAGHIPGALNRPFKNNLGPDGLHFKPAAQLRAELAPLLAPFTAEQVVQQCGSGVTACHNILAMQHAGLGGSILYPGSWSEWSADASRPIARSCS